ncbi:hypothetical protein M407DRAFT_241767 [Tulasnella calospora MUT 4182]|uniref:Uncharacterized protein n=1 Tax=Tulasnella calospora MUT 4182 TaxID=1051891 RepID=A0A0C3QHV5_9AGAM|nr:hypothetical protein M407DRAFT_241767 [Tulasnella calospora MUT 4182]
MVVSPMAMATSAGLSGALSMLSLFHRLTPPPIPAEIISTFDPQPPSPALLHRGRHTATVNRTPKPLDLLLSNLPLQN